MFCCLRKQKFYTHWYLTFNSSFKNKNNNKINVNQFTHVHVDFKVAQTNTFRKVLEEKIIFVICHVHCLKALYNKLKLRGLMKND